MAGPKPKIKDSQGRVIIPNRSLKAEFPIHAQQQADNRDDGGCSCGLYNIRGACGHTFEKMFYLKCGGSVSEKTGRPVICKKPATRIMIDHAVVSVRCRRCRALNPIIGQGEPNPPTSTSSTATTAAANSVAIVATGPAITVEVSGPPARTTEASEQSPLATADTVMTDGSSGESQASAE